MSPEERHNAILVVDDDPGLLVLIERVLRVHGWDVITASSGADALAILAAQSTELMLLDISLPDVNAPELIALLAERSCPTRYIIITGQSAGEVAVDMMKRGALDYLIKDAQFLELLPEVVQRALDRIDHEERLRQAEETLRESEARLRSTLDNMIEGCQIVGPDWRYRYANAAAIRHARKTREELIGHTMMESYPRIESTDLFAALRNCMESRTPSRFENDFTFPDGALAMFDISILPFEDGILILSFDITDQKYLQKQVLEISDREQSRMGRDLHDGLCQHLAGIEFRLLTLKQALVGRASALAREANELARLVRDAIEQTRTLARGLSPVMLDSQGLMIGLEELCHNTQNTFHISCTFHCPAPVLLYDNAAATHLYRIAQEAVQNAIRHGKPKSIVINLIQQNGRVILGVKDDGIGIDQDVARQKRGMGLRIMQYRAGMVGGTLAVQRDRVGGTSVVCSLRLPAVEAAAHSV